jgi:hypothetical protein
VAGTTVRVRGLAELNRALNNLNKEAKRAVLDELKKTAEPVAADARSKISRYQGASLGTIKPRATGRSVFVTQNARKVTGKRGDFGALQMTRGLMPALDENTDKIVTGLEHAIDRLAAREGF